MARELKYHSPNTDLAALQRELAASRGSADPVESEYSDEYADADEDDEDLDEDDGPEANGGGGSRGGSGWGSR